LLDASSVSQRVRTFEFSISGTTPSAVNNTLIDDNSSGHPVVAIMPNNARVAYFYERNTGGDVYAITRRPTADLTNLTASNYIGISDGAYANGATATIQVVGSVDDAQSGLTPGLTYYVQDDGSLGTEPTTPSVQAGVAVAATKLLIK
jgi:hypothetical protein